MKSFRFKSLIRRYTVSFTIEYPVNQSKPTNPADYDDLGKLINSGNQPNVQQSEGAIVSPTDKQIYQSGGRITSSDRLLYSLVYDIPDKSKIRYKGTTYSVESQSDYSDIADFSVYTLKGVDQFD